MDALRTQFRDAMSRLGAAVNIITTAGPAGRAGFTASAVCSVTDDPAMLLVCINRGSRAYPYVIQNGVMCVNVLGGPHRPVSDSFAGFTTTTMDERFGTGSWTVLSTGAPALEGASAAVDCVIEDVVEKGTHHRPRPFGIRPDLVGAGLPRRRHRAGLTRPSEPP